MKIYIYNNNNLNEFVEEIQTEDIELYEGCYTTVQNVPCEQQYKSYAYNVETSGWTDLIDDYRNVIIYSIYDSRYFKISHRTALQDAFTTVAPPTSGQFYKFINNVWIKQLIKSKDQLKEQNYKLKRDYAYSHINVVSGTVTFQFDTDEKSISLINSTLIAMDYSNSQTISWKCYIDNQPVMINLTKTQFKTIFAAGMNMINSYFAVEGQINAQIQTLTDQNLQDQTFLQNFSQTMTEKYEQVDNTITI